MQPAGITARHHQLSAKQCDEEYCTQIVEPTLQAFEGVLCVGWPGKITGNVHNLDNCPRGVGTNKTDKFYTAFCSKIRLPQGWCWSCMAYQVSDTLQFILFYFECNFPERVFGHPYGSPNSCPWRGIIIRIIYIFQRLRILCSLLLANLNLNDI